jgi:TrmH family RNA methyltransferase
MRLKKYDRDAPYAYSFGVFPTLELLKFQSRFTEQVLLHSAGEANSGIDKIKALCKTARIPCLVDDRLVERLSPRENTYAIGIFTKYRGKLKASADHVVLVQPSDMGNLGTALRTLLGFGVSNLALIRPAADCFDPRVVRASMGALFQMNVCYYDHFADYQAAYPAHHLYPFMTDGRVSLGEARFDPPYTLVFGSESAGLPAAFHEYGSSVRITHQGVIDSLNLSVAIGIGLYVAAQQPG